jgi:PilZ domain
MNERRRDPRHVINRMAMLQTNPHALPRDCMVTDISLGGARLFAGGVEVPDRFHLQITGEKGGYRECEVVWRLGSEIGVAFVMRERRPRRAAN